MTLIQCGQRARAKISRLSATFAADASTSDKDEETPFEIRSIYAERANCHEAVDRMASNGLVPDAAALSVCATHVGELAELRRQIVREQQGMDDCRRRLAALFPAPVAPPPEPDPLPPARTIPRLGDLLGGNGKGLFH